MIIVGNWESQSDHIGIETAIFAFCIFFIMNHNQTILELKLVGVSIPAGEELNHNQTILELKR